MGALLEYLDQEPWRFLISFGAILFLSLNLAAILTLAERKVAGYIQLRHGPNRVGPRGLLQPAADMVKLFTKENLSPRGSDRWVFLAAPIAMFLPAPLIWLVVPFAPGVVVADLNIALLFFISITSIGALGVIMAGYGSRSNFSLLGALRGAGQLISYEVPLILSCSGSRYSLGACRSWMWSTPRPAGSGIGTSGSSCRCSSRSTSPESLRSSGFRSTCRRERARSSVGSWSSIPG